MKGKSESSEGSDAFDMFMPSKVVRMLWRHKFMAVSIILLGTTLSALYTATLPVLYRSTASLLIENYNPNILTGEMQMPTIDFEIGTAYKILAESRPVAQRARELAAEPIGGAFEGRVQTQLLYLSVMDGDPRRAAKLANAWQRAFSEEMVRRSQYVATSAREFLDKSVPELRANWIKSQDELNRFASETHFDAQEFERSPVRRRIEDYPARLDDIRLKLNELEAEKRLLERKDITTTDLLQLPRARTDESLQALLKQIEMRRLKLLDMSERYRSDADEVKVVQESISKLMTEVQNASASLVRRIEFEYQKLKEESARLNEQIGQAQDEFTALKKNADQYKQLQSDVQRAERIYSDMAAKRGENEVISRYTLNTARPWESAEEAMAPYSPNWNKNVMSGLLLSLMLATLSAFIMEMLDDTVKTSRGLEKKMGVTTLGMVPASALNMSDSDGYVMVQRQARSAIADHFRNIHIALEVTHGIQSQGKAFIVTITSAGPNEGKSFVSSNLATLFASLSRRVLLVDADFRKCSLSRAFNQRPKTGLMDIISTGRWSKDAAIHNAAQGYWFLPAPRDQEELGSFDPQAFSMALDLMKKDFDVIIFDTPPVLAMADASAIARVSDVTILVARSRKTRMRELERAAAAVYGANAKEVTFIVNFVDPADARAEAYGYGGYGAGYGYSAPTPARGGAADAARFKNRKSSTGDRGAAS